MQKINGVIVYIDNGIDKEDISKALVENFKTNYILYFTSKQLIENNFILNNRDIIKLVIMDWSLWDDYDIKPSDISESQRKEQELQIKKMEKNNVEFIKTCLSNYLPIVIFSKCKEGEIEQKLIEYELLESSKDEQPLLLISEKKADITDILNDWYDKIPSAKIFDFAQSCLFEAQRKFFADLIIIKNSWIKSLWETICAEYMLNKCTYDEKKDEFNLVFKNFINHIINCIINRVEVSDGFLDAALVECIKGIASNKEDAQKLIESMNYIQSDKISNVLMPGDVFNVGDEYYINIRAECDTVRADKGEIKAYLLKGILIPHEKFVNEKICSICLGEHQKPNSFLGNHYQLLYNDVNFTIPYICDGKIIQFQFKNLVVENYDITTQSVKVDKKSFNRVGRVLPPYSIKLQQRYSQYLSRIGLDAIPEIIVKS